MPHFTDAERAYLAAQFLGRLATVGAAHEPYVVPVAFRHEPDGDTIDIGGFHIADTKKYRNLAGNDQVAFVVDDVVSRDPWHARGIEIRGSAAAVATGGDQIMAGFAPEFIRITPRRIVSWGLEPGAPNRVDRRTVD